MAYGVDECRRCGRPIKPPDPEALARYVKAAKQKPTMTPPEWREAGWKAAPTRHQMSRPLDGICYLCKPIVRAKYARYPSAPVFAGMFMLILGLAFAVWFIAGRGS